MEKAFPLTRTQTAQSVSAGFYQEMAAESVDQYLQCSCLFFVQHCESFMTNGHRLNPLHQVGLRLNFP